MDDDLVLRSLGEELERDDPELAALLTGTALIRPPLETTAHEAPAADAQSTDAPISDAPISGAPSRPVHQRSLLWPLLGVLLLAVPVLIAALLLPARVSLGVTGMLLILGSPLAVCWLCAVTDRADPDATPDP